MVRVPPILDEKETPCERARHALGMQLSYLTETEIKHLQVVTDAQCEQTPHLIMVQIDEQDQSVMNDGCTAWWMPGGYIVYILMDKLPAQDLDFAIFWHDFSAEEREDVRRSFRRAMTWALAWHLHSPQY